MLFYRHSFLLLYYVILMQLYGLLTGFHFFCPCISFQPCHDQVDDLLLLCIRQRLMHWNPVPFIEATPAAAGCRMHCLKYRVAMHRSLLTIVDRSCRCKLLPDKIRGMNADDIHTLFFYVLLIFLRQMETLAKSGTFQLVQGFVFRLHQPIPFVLLPDATVAIYFAT